jgi:hypothetical protein
MGYSALQRGRIVKNSKSAGKTMARLCGAHWPINLQQELHDARFGMICVTPENVAEPWILFEAGALSRAIDQADVRVCPYLLGLETTDLKPPLGHFSAPRRIARTRSSLFEALTMP